MAESTLASVASLASKRGATLAVRVSTLWWALLVLLFLAAVPILFDVTWLLLPGLLLLAALLSLPLAWLWRSIWRPARLRRWQLVWIRASIGLWFLCCALVALPVYFLAITTETNPAIVPTVTLSNGSRTVVLQGMQHVGAERFYQAVVYDLEKALADGYVLAYEGVANSDAEADAWFRAALSQGKDLGNSYRELGKMCGLSYQIDYFAPLLADVKAHPERHITMDVNTRAMKQEYDRLMQVDVNFAAAMRKREQDQKSEAKEAPDFITYLIDRQRAGGRAQQALAGTLCRGLMTVVVRNSGDAGEEMNKVVVDFRNRYLAQQLLNDSRSKIYVTYGAGHLPGVMELMKREPGWKVESIKWMRTIAAPENLEGKL